MNIFQDFTLLKSFIAIAEAGSISAAAKVLRTTQPTVSRHLKKIEDNFGETLIHRNTHSMQLTPIGLQVLASARELMLLSDDAEYSIKSNHEALVGRIRLFSTIDFGQTVVTRLIIDFMQKYPDITFDLSYSNRPLQMIDEGCDLGIVAGHIKDQSVIVKRIGYIKRCIVTTPLYIKENPLPSEVFGLESHKWLALSNSQFGHLNKIELYNDKAQQKSFIVNPILTFEGVTSIKEALHMNAGIAIMPEWLIEKELAQGDFVRIFPEYNAENIPVQIVYPVQKSKPKRITKFINFANSYMAKALGSSILS